MSAPTPSRCKTHPSVDPRSGDAPQASDSASALDGECATNEDEGQEDPCLREDVNGAHLQEMLEASRSRALSEPGDHCGGGLTDALRSPRSESVATLTRTEEVDPDMMSDFIRGSQRRERWLVEQNRNAPSELGGAEVQPEHESPLGRVVGATHGDSGPSATPNSTSLGEGREVTEPLRSADGRGGLRSHGSTNPEYGTRLPQSPPHPGGCECWRCAEWRLQQADLKGWDILFDAVFNS